MKKEFYVYLHMNLLIYIPEVDVGHTRKTFAAILLTNLVRPRRL